MKKQKPRVLYINHNFNGVSGASIMAINTNNLFISHDYETAVFTSKGMHYDNDYKYAKYFPEYKPTRPIEKLLYYYNIQAQKKLELMLDDFKPDIIHMHNIYMPHMTYSIIKPCYKRKLPIIMTVHDPHIICPVKKLLKGNNEICYNVLCKGYNKLGCYFNRCENGLMYRSFVTAFAAFINKLTGYEKQIAKFISPSQALKDIIVKNNKDIPPEKVIVINNYIASSELSSIKPNYDNKGYFLYIGRLVPEKGVHFLLQAAKDLPKNIEFHIVGDGPEEDKLKDYVKENCLENVKFLGRKNREEIKEEYQNCIASILPCNWLEIFGLTNIEAFANGKPVIAANIGGIPEIVEHNTNGMLFEPTNVEQLKDCILRYWNNPDLVVEHGKNGREKVLKYYTEENYYEKLSTLYDEVLTNAK